MKLEGKVWRYGDNIDTDVIIPARYLNTFDPKELASHCMVDIDESFAPNVKAGDIMVGGRNFGCGSSREHAPVAIKASGVPVVIAGGERMESTRQILQMVHDSIKAGGAGISVGRNVFQHPSRVNLVKALRAIVHDNAGVDQALTLVGE